MTFPTWRRPSRCESGHCVEVKIYENAVFVRNSERPETVIAYTPQEWEAELANIRRDGLPEEAMIRTDDGQWEWPRGGNALWLTSDEMDAFVDGVNEGEFDLKEPADAQA